MLFIKDGLKIDADGSARLYDLIRSWGYVSEDAIIAAERKRRKKEALDSWLKDRMCPGCMKSKQNCVCCD